MSAKTPEQELDRVYARLPGIRCKRKCQECCGPIVMSRIERERLVSRVPSLQFRQGTMALESGQEIGQGFRPVACDICPLLSAAGECTAYDIRPLICRLWGLVQTMRCPFGCTPDRWVGGRESYKLLKEVERISRKAA